ncbi:hypothetical protein G4Y73_04600 [Wenzhouxiangella sp. XN201]|uniref:hypothetical protein n=1 Tax=Wenzhouxiangella sp. XN201 TaxID=2710755 RepID=UPI0013C904EA|nr:hypothetical protein [Wenzhouxiangella sp. XN201]NEZ03428.1 hypothetical protein [Wenzhouxiangella sp. XN201]
MSNSNSLSTYDSLSWGVLCFAIFGILLTGALYLPGLGGTFHFDDRPNLEGLEDVKDFTSALLFASTNESGPLGRPVALASFLLESDSYPDDTHTFLRTNILIHLINGILVFFFTRKLLQAADVDSSQSQWVALVAAILWTILPIHAATVLLVIQRMTLLSTTFVLLGITGYLYSRSASSVSPIFRLTLMTTWLFFAGLLGVFTKENAAVLPALTLVMELTLLKRPFDNQRLLWRTWIALFLALPTVLIFSYLAFRLPYTQPAIDFRGFSGSERLLTQSWVLWDYIRQAFLPSALNIHAFYDSVSASKSLFEPKVAISLSAWILVSVLAIWLRKAVPFLAFGVFWYLIAQSIESSTIPLELYFSHRSYVPLIGLAILLGWAIHASWLRFQKAAIFGFSGYFLILAFVLFNTSSIWGKPRLAAEIWYGQQPESPRATGFLLEQYVDENDYPAALKLLKRKSSDPDQGYLYEVQRLALHCIFRQRPVLDIDIGNLVSRIQSGEFTHAYTDAIEKLADTHLSGDCDLLELEDLRRITVAPFENDGYAASRSARHALHKLTARLDIATGISGSAVDHLMRAIEIRHDPSAARTIFNIHSANGNRQGIHQLVEMMRSEPPRNPVTRKLWLDLADFFEGQMKKAPASAGALSVDSPLLSSF